ncbi:dienelactone hydrolase family protein [Pelomonas sp. SE-A7]|uniref:dienelactone hydrolase family protein n=1 Tax=Pelomonas sp. SE-A7 TaxID=3054953 RepID=UPI00259CE3CB|nr:dienelactone hydrolase family protein [Pelomonas sp. SE-A7]MDM4767237.1 dienelactone hydrolase family protein [Pelomonas sp. SE-A7]
MPASESSRRDFIRASLGSGFAAAVLPVTAQTIKTSSDGLTVGEVSIAVGDSFKLPAYRAAPVQAKGKLPVVLVVSEIFGVHEHIADVARRFARLGYLAIAPELFVRAGDPSEYGEIAKLIAEIVAKTPDAQVMGDLDACLAWAGANGGDLERVAITGFCWGGRISWLYAAHQARLKAAVAWYGRLDGERNTVYPRHPVDLPPELKAPVLGLYGGKDEGIPQVHVERMRETLKQGSDAARRSEVQVYPDAPHAFHADYRPSYREADARDGWQRCLAWFKAKGV